MFRKFAMILVVLALAIGTLGSVAQAQDKVIVGLSFSDFATERWKNEEVLMTGLLEDLGYEVISQSAEYDVKAQNDQIDNMVSQGAKAIIVVAQDGDAAATAVSRAAEEGVLIIAYDRLIKSPDIAAYVSFNNVEVGRQQALGVMTAVDIEGGMYTEDSPLRLVMLGGSPTDNNAILFRQGQMEIVQPYVDQGIVEIVADQWVDNWDAANALTIMDNILTAQNNEIDAVVASNDQTALGALQAMSAQGLAGIVPISGQDATGPGCNSIVRGELTVSILKDIRDLTPLAINLVDQLLQGEEVVLEVKGEPVDLAEYTLAELTNDDSLEGSVMAAFLPVQQVTADNVYELVVESFFQSYDDVYMDVPEDQLPPRPEEMGE